MAKGWGRALIGLAVVLAGTTAADALAPPAASAPRAAVRPVVDAATLSPPAASTGTFSGVDCRQGGGCIAVGFSGGGALAASWTGSNWTLRPTPAGGRLVAVSCGAPTSCVAVGYESGAAQAAFWGGTHWHPLAPLDAPGATSTWLNSVSCPTPKWCMAVGVGTPDGGQTLTAMAETWDGSRWTLRGLPLPAGANFTELDGVSCTSPSACSAVGSYHGGNYIVLALAESWDGRGWTYRATPNPPGRVSDGLDGIDCLTPDGCLAVGSYGTKDGLWHAFAELWNGAGWFLAPAGNPAGAIFTQLDAVDCPSPSACVAVGYTTDADLVTRPLAEWDLSGHWSSQPLPAVPAPGLLDAVSCSAVDRCTAGGSAGSVLISVSWGGSSWQRELIAPIVAVVPATPGGYYLVAADGTVYPYGGAPFHGDLAGVPLSAPIVGAAADPHTGGYWLVGADGGVYGFGAPFYGSTGGERLAAPVVGIAAATGGDGYRLVAADGGVFDFGPGAHFHGSMGGRRLTEPIVGLADDAATGGYWLVASDGGIFAFAARFLGSTGGMQLTAPIVGMAAVEAGDGYRLVASDGGVFDFGAARYSGSLGDRVLASPIVGIAADGAGYWLAHSDGDVNALGGVPAFGGA